MFLFVLWDCNYCNGIIDELLAEQISQLCIINTIQWCRIDSCHMIGTQQWGNRVLTLFIRELHIFFKKWLALSRCFDLHCRFHVTIKNSPPHPGKSDKLAWRWEEGMLHVPQELAVGINGPEAMDPPAWRQPPTPNYKCSVKHWKYTHSASVSLSFNRR